MLVLTLRTNDITIFGGKNGKLASKNSSGNESRPRREKMMKWVFKTPAIDPDWIISKTGTRSWKFFSKNFHVVEKTCETLAVYGLKY